MRQPIQLETESIFARHCRAISSFCPFIVPSANQRLLLARTLNIPSCVLDAERILFGELVVETESFRRHRARLSATARHLLCYNLVVNWTDKSAPAMHELLAWPTYVAKLLYTSKAIMFGSFPERERTKTRNGALIPEPPVSFISIRSKVAGLDVRFFDKNPNLLAPHVDGVDDLENVHQRAFATGVPDNLLDAGVVAQPSYYERVRAWAESILAIDDQDSTLSARQRSALSKEGFDAVELRLSHLRRMRR